jgi:hypothetical protein
MIRLQQFNTLSHRLNWIEFLNYKFTESEFNINSTVVVRLELYKGEVSFFLTGFSCGFLTINEKNVLISALGATLSSLQGRLM